MIATKRPISVVIPAFNEEKRIVATLQHLIAVFDRYGLAEVVVVDDGSIDRTSEFVAKVASQAPRGVSVRPERLAVNSGKGAALRAGAALAIGELILFLDADLAVAPEAIIPAREAIAAGADLVIGSRVHEDGVDLRRSQPIPRRIAGRLFVEVRRRLIGLPYRDTQCPFKLITRELAEELIPLATIDGWSFDVELLVLAERSGARVISIPVQFAHEEGSTVQLGARASLRVLRELMQIRAAHGAA